MVRSFKIKHKKWNTQIKQNHFSIKSQIAEKWYHTKCKLKTYYFSPKNLFLTKNFLFFDKCYFRQKIIFLAKIFIFEEIFYFWPKILFWTKRFIFDEQFYLWRKKYFFFVKMFTFDQNIFVRICLNWTGFYQGILEMEV